MHIKLWIPFNSYTEYEHTNFHILKMSIKNVMNNESCTYINTEILIENIIIFVCFLMNDYFAAVNKGKNFV